ncbi:MAG: T9SS type A sorting domain-containing protein [Bacteroidaceae bacterium]|nr:T9SS type A sorting domain-containing protein [Bacteroidaceae bacterium]
MNKRFTLLVLLLSIFVSTFAAEKCEVVFTGTPWGIMGVSSNGRYIVGTRQYTEAYRFDVQEARLMVVPTKGEYDDMCFSDVTDDGMIVGKDHDMLPAIYRTETESWERLPFPYSAITEGYANEVTSDGKVIVGFIMGSIDPSKPYTVFPCVWRLQEDGSYKYEELPNPETDFLGTKTQFISTRTISADGNTVVGVWVEKKGRYYQPIVYHYNGTEWTYETPFFDLTFNGNDIYNKWMAEEPNLNDYITVPPGDPEYIYCVEDFQMAFAEWQYNFWQEWKTGFEVTSVPVVMSSNGKWLAPMATETEYAWHPGATSIEKASVVSYPVLFNLETGELFKFKDIQGGESWYTYGVSNDGDMISSDGYNFYLKPADSENAFEISDWLKQEYDFDLMSYLPSNTQYVECGTISSDMTMLAGVYRSVTPSGELDNKEVFCITLPGFMSDIKKTLDTPRNENIVMAGEELRFGSEAQDIVIYDVCGKQVMSHAGKVSTLNVANLSKGIYVVTAEMNGVKATGKVYKF